MWSAQCLVKNEKTIFVYRLGLAASRPQARQIIGHGLLAVNGKKLNIPSYIVKTGDVISINPSKKNVKIFKELGEKLKGKEVPGWLNFDIKKMTAKVLHVPEMSSINPTFNVQIIVEFYSR